MKRWIFIPLLFAVSASTYAFPFPDKQPPGYYFYTTNTPCGKEYVPMYQEPRFGLYGKHNCPYVKDCQRCRDITCDNRTGWHGMVRCYNKEGLSIEYYYR